MSNKKGVGNKKIQVASTAPKQPSKMKQIVGLPKWAWAVSAMSIDPENIQSPWYARIALKTAKKIRVLVRFWKQWWVVFCFATVFILFYLLPQKHFGLDHFVHMTSSAAAMQLLVVIIGSLAAILAIIFSVILVTLEVLKKRPYRGRLSTILSVRPFRELLLLYAATILSSVFVLASIHDTLTIRNVHMTYFEIVMYVTALLVLYPALKKLLDAADPRSPIPKMLDALDKNVAQFGRFAITRDSEVAPAEAFHPIFVLRDIALKALTDDDEITTIQIIYDMSLKLDEIVASVPDGKERRSVIDAFLLVWRSLMIRAIRLESEGVLFVLIDVIKAINVSTSKRDFMWYELLEVNDFHLELFNRSSAAGFEEVASRAIYLFEGIFEWNVPKNLPPAAALSWFTEQPKDEKWQHNSDKELKWSHLTSDFIRFIQRATISSIQLKSEALTGAGVAVLEHLLGDVAKADGLTDKQKSVIMAQITWGIKDALIQALDKGYITQFYLLLPGLGDYPNADIAVSDKEYSKYPFVFYKEILKKAIDKGSLGSFSIDSIRMLAFHLADRLKQVKLEKPRKLLLYLVDLVDVIRINAQKDLNEQNRECYIAAYDALDSMQKIVAELKDKELDDKIKKSLSKFSKIKALKQGQNRYDDLW